MAGYQEMAPGIFQLRQEVRKGWIPFEMNLYALPGKEGLLFDAGSGTRGAVAHMVRLLDAIEEKTGRRVRRVLPSHAHWDHFSGASTLAERRRMEVLLTEAMVPLVRTRRGYRAAYLDVESALFPRGNGLKELFRSIRSRLMDEFFFLIAGVRAVTGPFTLITVGETLETDAGEWKVMAGPGHCDSHIMLWNPEAGILLGGDNVLADITTWLGPPHSDILAYQKTLETICHLPGLTLILPAHGRAIIDPLKRITQIITHRKKRLGEIRDKLDSAGSHGLNAHDLIGHYYPNLGPLKRALARGWIESTLLHLMKEGEVNRVAEGGGWRYRKL